MKKFRGKALAALLSLALIASSLPVTLASASTKSVTGTVSDTGNDSIYLANGGANTVYDNLQTWINPSLDTKDHQDVTDVKIDAISHASGDKLVSWKVDTDNGNATSLTVKSSTNNGKEILSVLYEGTYSNSDGDDVTVKARKNFTVYVLDEGSLVVGKYYSDPATRDCKSIEAPATFAQTANSFVDLGVYKVVTGANAEATYVPQTVATDTSEDVALTTSNDNIHFDFVVDASNTVDSTGTVEVVATVGKNQVKQDDATPLLAIGSDTPTAVYKTDASVASVTVTAKRIVSGAISSATADKATLNTKIEKKVDVKAVTVISGSGATGDLYSAAYRFDAATAFVIDKDGSKTYLGNTDGTSHTADKTNGYVITDSEVVFPVGTVSVSMGDGSVKKISGTVGTTATAGLSINGGSVSAIDVDDGDVTVTDGNVGDITTDGEGTVTVTGGKTGAIDTTDATAGDVTVNSGTVGSIDVGDGSVVTIQSDNEDTPVVTGAISASNVTVYSDQSKVTVGDITVSADSGTVKFEGDDIAAGKVDCDYRSTTLELGQDDEAFVGAISSIDNATNATITTMNEDTVATVNGSVDTDTIDVATDSDLKFTGSVNVDTVEGDGMMTIAAGNLYVTGSVSGTGLKLSDSTLASGTTVFKADSDAVSVDDFVPYGFTLTKVTGSSVDGFKIDTLDFAGLQINKTTSSIAEGYSETFTATAYPGGTAIPDGDVVSWSFDGSDAVFDVTTSGNTATVKVLAVDPDFSSENKGTLTATLQDADGYDLTDYGTASVDVSAVKTPAVVSDTTADFTMAPGASYQFKITSASAPTMTAGTAGVLDVTNVGMSGNDYFIKVTAAANAAGKQTGIYLNGTKLLVVTVAGTPSFTSDTTSAVKVAKGASYQYKITASAAPSFALGTAGVFNYTLVSQSGNNYFYKITAVGASGAQTGVYVNGTKVNVATVA